MPTNRGEDTLKLTAQCLCKSQTFTAPIPRSLLPLSAIYCHCTSCRRATGALYSTYVPWPGDGGAIGASSLQRYVFAGSVTLLFCGVCGSTMFAETVADDGSSGGGQPQYGVQTGVLANIPDIPGGVVKIAHHVFVDDTLDGGATPWLRDINADGSQARLWRGRRGGEEISSSSPHHASFSREARKEDDEKEIPIRCHCGGVDLALRHPVAEYATTPQSELPWFIDPVSKKSLGGFDACDSCRLSSGADIFHWTFALLRHLSFPKVSSSSSAKFPASSIELKSAVEASPADRDPRWGTLAFYASSPGVQRYFCSRCSACVFYAADDRPDLVDVAIGLLSSRSGARAEGLLSWDYGGKMVWREDVSGGWREGFVERVEAAADAWRMERGYPKNWRRIQKEAAAMKDLRE
ncbi:Mss4-like protein [Xylaria arbuscula]|nr:Mss4-like protein [Xylaria arbuscula]